MRVKNCGKAHITPPRSKIPTSPDRGNMGFPDLPPAVELSRSFPDERVLHRKVISPKTSI